MRNDFSRSMRLMAIVGPLSALLAACGGGGGGDNPPAGSTVVVSGKITFDRIPFNATLGTGLNAAAPVESPAREVVVEAISGSSAVASATTNASGDFSLTVPTQTNIFLRAKAQMLKTGTAPTWNFSVRNNANDDALYVLDGSSFDTGTANTTRNLRATSGWGGSSYTGTRAAAPFAILDTVYRAKELILTASATTAFPDLNLFWSDQNRSAVPFCPDSGNIGTTSYVVFVPDPDSVDDCDPPRTGMSGIYILGDFSQQDTDEFDQHVIAHEFGHYIEDNFSRSDSIGGSHAPGELLDLRVAFGEGWGNAYSAMTLNDPVYRDSDSGVSQDGGFNVESDGNGAEGWFSEFSVGEILWDIFDPVGESGDAVALGFTPIYSVMRGPQVSTDALTSIFSFGAAIRSASSADAAAIGTLLTGEQISGTDAFGSDEDNPGTDATVLPLYPQIQRNVPVNVCSRSTSGNGSANKLGNRRFFRFNNDIARLVAIQATGAATAPSVPATDPDIFVHRQGELVAVGMSDNNDGNETIAQFPLPAGDYIIEVYDFDIDGAAPAPRCMNVSIQGA